MEERMERERKVWNEHKDLLLAGERAFLFVVVRAISSLSF